MEAGYGVTPEPALPHNQAGNSELLQRLRTLFESQSLAVLATCSEAQPHGSLVAFAATDDLTRVLFATNRATRKFAQIAANPAVALVADSRSNREEDFDQAIAVTVFGSAAEAEGAERADLLPLYLAKHPQLRSFVDAPTCALVKVAVQKYSVVTDFQNVTVLRIEK